MFIYNQDFCNKITQLCIKHFKSLPKTGKPDINEWTILSCVVQHNCINDNLEIVSLGTGSKCIGATKMSPNGDILNDSHAEIICRRAFLRYLYHEITNAYSSKNESIFTINNDKCELHENISFHFFTTHVPCGDASIFPKQNDDNVGSLIINSSKSQNKRPNETHIDSSNKKIKTEDIFRTGAKCLQNDVNQDPKQRGNEYHILGAIRTKPGRGDPTLSVSCSDKLSKWTFLGIQGALILFFLKCPIYLKSVTIAGNVPFSEESLLRCLKNRFSTNLNLPKPFQYTIPLIGQADVEFEFFKDDLKRPCPTSIIWAKLPIRSFEVAVDGKKQGVTKKNKHRKEGRLLICKKELFSTFINIISENNLNLKYLKLELLSYKEVKNNSEYYKIWNVVKNKIFKIWTEKPENLLNFMYDT